MNNEIVWNKFKKNKKKQYNDKTLINIAINDDNACE